MDIDALRLQTPGCAYRVHLNNAGAALLSQPTLDAMTVHLRREAEIGGYEAAAAAREEIDETYLALAELLGGRGDEVALFDNATHAWNAAFYSIPLGPGGLRRWRCVIAPAAGRFTQLYGWCARCVGQGGVDVEQSARRAVVEAEPALSQSTTAVGG